MHLDIITPDKKVFSGEIIAVTVPGTKGTFQVLHNHAPIISTLANGKVKVKTKEGIATYMVNGGVIEVLKNNIVLLAESIG